MWIDRGWQPTAIGFCPSEAAWHREMKRLNAEQPWPGHNNTNGCTHWLKHDKTGQSVIIVCLFQKAETDALNVIMTLVHEAVHVWQFLCEYIGEEKPGIEMEAYGIENIARGLVEAYTATQGKGKEWLPSQTASSLKSARDL